MARWQQNKKKTPRSRTEDKWTRRQEKPQSKTTRWHDDNKVKEDTTAQGMDEAAINNCTDLGGGATNTQATGRRHHIWNGKVKTTIPDTNRIKSSVFSGSRIENSVLQSKWLDQARTVVISRTVFKLGTTNPNQYVYMSVNNREDNNYQKDRCCMW